MNISINELADIERELAECLWNMKALRYELQDATQKNDLHQLRQVSEEMQQVNLRWDELRKQQQEW